jgi:hypothetical protein
MDFNFYDQFKDHSTIELLKIVRNPSGYQPEAIEAVTKVLSERNITGADMEEVDAYFNEQKNKVERKAEKINAFKEKAADLLEPITNPGPEIKPVKWLNILLLVMGLQYLWTFFKTMKMFVGILGCRGCTVDITVIWLLLLLLYPPVIFYLLLKKKRWGWILLFAENLVSFIISIRQSFTFFKYQHYHLGDTGTFLVSMLIKAGFCYFLWRKEIATFFGISATDKKNTTLVAVIIAALFIVIFG